MADSILRISQVKRRFGRCRSGIYADAAAGLLTKPVKIGERASGWPESEVDAVLAARIAAKSQDEIRALVAQLHRKRKGS